MKKKTKLIFSFFSIVFAVLALVSGCDMDGLISKPFNPDDDSSDGFDPSIPYLTIVNLPSNTRKNHFSNLFIYNSSSATAACAEYEQIVILNENGSVTAKIPVSYIANPNYFKETGTFIVSFVVNIDYLTHFVIKESDKLKLYFTNGNALFDASLIPPPPPPYLTVKSLPRNTRLQNISNVFIYDSAGAAVAECSDYDQIIVIRDSFSVTAMIPLNYKGSNDYFLETGNFIVSFFINIDFETQIIVKEDDKLTLFFTEGNALLDASFIPPAPPPPYLIIKSLPKNVKPQHFSNVFVYNSIGAAVARCLDYDLIVITTDSDFAVARIPLVYTSDGKPFRDSGYFTVSFSLNIPSYMEVEKTKGDDFYVAFTDGSGVFDLLINALSSVQLGYFSGGLVNPSDAAAPVVKSGTRFEMNGYYYSANSDMPVVPSSFTNTCIVYVYARLVFNQLEFIYSTTAPVYDSYKKGFYNGFARALFKFVFIRDSTNKYFAKTFVSDNWSHLRYQTTDSNTLPSQNLSQYYYLSGTGNPSQHTVALPAGAYLIVLFGAPGGLTGQSTSTVYGGSGGSVSEVVLLSDKTSFTFFTGEKGGNGQHNSYTYGNTGGIYESSGGGGSGSFAYSPDGYFLCAGGGGGSKGTSNGGGSSSPSWSFSSGGGAGGSIGGGGSGRSSGVIDAYSSGGNGGGVNGGSADGPRDYGYSDLTVHSYSLGFAGTNADYAGGSAAYFDLPSLYLWLNTNNANGKGGDDSGAAQAGGNNRNSIRGGGPASSTSNLPQNNGYIIVYKIN
jgi:hypothetical protein